nr:uncharacterized protein LOC113739352 [Coffea arabica]
MDQEECSEIKEEDKRWIPSRERCTRINIDAIVQKSKEKVGWGIVARNFERKLIMAWAMPNKYLSVLVVEKALAIQMALIKAKQKGWKEIEIQSNCKTIIGKLQEDSVEDVNCATVLEDIIKLWNEFDVCHFSFIRRIGNVVSHMLAKFAMNLITNVTWERDFPTWLNMSAKKDRTKQLI